MTLCEMIHLAFVPDVLVSLEILMWIITAIEIQICQAPIGCDAGIYWAELHIGWSFKIIIICEVYTSTLKYFVYDIYLSIDFTSVNM